jgi:type VI secretion system secreted protein VgrG
MASFLAALAPLLKAEGGYVNHPNDRGGATNLGITQAVYREYKNNPLADVAQITMPEAEDLYKRLYWNPLLLDSINSDRVADLLFNQAVNRGVNGAGKLLQRALNGLGSQLLVDGVVGPKTIDAANLVPDDRMLMRELVKAAQVAYVQIVEKNPSQLVFLEGWIRRTHEYFKHLS